MPTPWLGSYIGDTDDFRRLVEALEPLLICLYVAGYTVPEIAVVADGRGARLATRTATVDVGDPATWEEPPPPVPASVVAVLLALRPLAPAAPPTPGWAPLQLPALGVTGAAGWVVIQLEAADNASLRAALRSRVIADVAVVRDGFGTAGTTGPGLQHLYDVDQWAPISAAQLADHELAARDITRAVSLTAVDALGDELGLTDPAEDPGLPRLYQYRSLSDLVCSLAEGPDADPRGDADCRALLTNLRVTLAEMAQTPEYGDVTLTTALLDLETRGLVDILGPQAGADLSAVLAILALGDEDRLSPDQIGVLCAHLSAGPGQATDEAAARLRMEYPFVTDPALAARIVRAFVDICLAAEVVPNLPDPIGRSFEWYVDSLRLLMASASVRENDLAKAKAAVQSVWSVWSPLLVDPAVASKMLYGAVRLFALCADVDIAADVTVLALNHYGDALSRLTAHWRTDAGAAELVTEPALLGWGPDTFVTLCLSFWRLQTPGLESALTTAERTGVEQRLAAAYGTAPLTTSQIDAVEERFGELLAAELGGADPLSPKGRLADLLALIEQAASVQDIAERCDLAAVSSVLDEVLAEPECDGLLPELRARAANEVLGGGAAVAALGAALRTWILSDETQAYLGTIEPTRRDLAEAHLLDALARLSPELVEDTMVDNAAARFGAELNQLLADVDEDELTAELDKALAVKTIDVLQASESAGRELAKLLKAGVKIGPSHTATIHRWGFDSAIAIAWRLRQARLISDESLAVLYLGAVDLEELVEPRATALAAVPRMPAETRHLGNAGAVAAAAIAAAQLAQNGWNTPLVTGVGLVRDVVNGVLPAVDLVRALTGWVRDGAVLVDAAKRWECVAVLALWLQRGSALVSIVTSGYGAVAAYRAGDYIGAGLYVAAGLANGVLLYSLLLSTPTVVGVVLTLSAPVLAVIAAACTVVATVWKFWIQPWLAQRRQHAAYQQLIWEYRLVYASDVVLYPALPVDVITPLVGPDETAVTADTDLAVVEITGEVAPGLPDEFTDGIAAAQLVTVEDEEGVLHARSPVPGTVYWMVDAIDLEVLDDRPDPVRTPGPPGSFAKLEPAFESWLTGIAPSDVVLDVYVEVGRWVIPGDRVATIDEGTSSMDIFATHEGRVVMLVPPGQTLGSPRAAARVRSEGRDLLIEFAEASGP